MQQYINDDVIPIIGKFCNIYTLIRLSKISRNSYLLASNILLQKINNLPMRICIEYNIKNNIRIHEVWITIGYLNNVQYKEKCNICDNGRWKKYKDDFIFHNEKSIFSNYQVRFLVYEGKLEGILDYIKNSNNLLIMIHIDNDRKKIKLCNNTDDHNNGYFYFEEVKTTILSLDNDIDLSIDQNKNFNCVNYGNYPYNCNMTTEYIGYIFN